MGLLRWCSRPSRVALGAMCVLVMATVVSVWVMQSRAAVVYWSVQPDFPLAPPTDSELPARAAPDATEPVESHINSSRSRSPKHTRTGAHNVIPSVMHRLFGFWDRSGTDSPNSHPDALLGMEQSGSAWMVFLRAVRGVAMDAMEVRMDQTALNWSAPAWWLSVWLRSYSASHSADHPATVALRRVLALCGCGGVVVSEGTLCASLSAAHRDLTAHFDGSVLRGHSKHQNTFRGWLERHPSPCMAHIVWTPASLRMAFVRATWMFSQNGMMLSDVQRTDLVRLLLLYEYGGVYLDIDVHTATKSQVHGISLGHFLTPIASDARSGDGDGHPCSVVMSHESVLSRYPLHKTHAASLHPPDRSMVPWRGQTPELPVRISNFFMASRRWHPLFLYTLLLSVERICRGETARTAVGHAYWRELLGALENGMCPGQKTAHDNTGGRGIYRGARSAYGVLYTTGPDALTTAAHITAGILCGSGVASGCPRLENALSVVRNGSVNVIARQSEMRRLCGSGDRPCAYLQSALVQSILADEPTSLVADADSWLRLLNDAFVDGANRADSILNDGGSGGGGDGGGDVGWWCVLERPLDQEIFGHYTSGQSGWRADLRKRKR